MIEKLLKYSNKRLFPGNYMFGPEWIVLGVNNVCNLHCKMCDVGTNNRETNFAQNLVGTHPINMPPELITRIIDQMSEFCPTAKLGYAFTEPLVYPHLEMSLQYAKSKKIHTSITTNALTLRQKSKALVEADLTELFISLDGPQDIHNEIRGHSKSFQYALDGIDAVFALNPIQPISIFCVITEWNIGHLKEFADFFKSYPLARLGFMQTNFTPQHVVDTHNDIWKSSYPATASNIAEINIENFDLELLWDEMTAIKKESYPFTVSFSPEISSKEKLYEFYHKPEKIIGRMCNDIFSNIMIKSDGSVIPAHGRCYNLTLGNIYENTLKEIWNDKILNKFRTDIMASGGLLPACSRCCSAF